MPSPFPGMDPYLEGSLWKSVHSRLIVAIADALNEQLDERYRVEIEQRTYFTGAESSLSIGIPDVAVLSNAETAQARDQAQTIRNTVQSRRLRNISSFANRLDKKPRRNHES